MKKIIIALFGLLYCIFPQIGIASNQREGVNSFYIDSIANEDVLITKNQRLAIAYLNHISAVLANVEEFNNKQILTDEYNSIWENSTIEQLVGFPAVVKFQNNLLETLQQMIINNEDYNRLYNKFEKRKNQAARDAITNALNGVYLLGGNPYSAIANTVLATARTALDYSAIISTLDDEFSEQAWQLEKENLIELTDLRMKSRNVAYELFSQHNLLEKYRINDDIKELSEIIHTTGNNYTLRSSKLELIINKFRYYAPFWYYLGDAYMNMHLKEKALLAFAEYEKLYNEAPIFRKDNYTGIIAANKLQIHMNVYSEEQKEILINQALNNLPTDGNLYLFCAVTYLENMHNPDKCMELIYRSLMNGRVTAKDETILYLTLLLHKNPSYKGKYKPLLEKIDEVVAEGKPLLSLSTFSQYLAIRNANNRLLSYIDNIKIIRQDGKSSLWWWIGCFLFVIVGITLCCFTFYFYIDAISCFLIAVFLGYMGYNVKPSVSKIQIPSYIDVSSGVVELKALEIEPNKKVNIYNMEKYSINTGHTMDELKQRFPYLEKEEVPLYFKKMDNGYYRFRFGQNLQSIDSRMSYLDREKMKENCRQAEKKRGFEIQVKKFEKINKLNWEKVNSVSQDSMLCMLSYNQLKLPQYSDYEFEFANLTNVSYLLLSLSNIEMIYKKVYNESRLIAFKCNNQYYYPSYIIVDKEIVKRKKNKINEKSPLEVQKIKKGFVDKIWNWLKFWE